MKEKWNVEGFFLTGCVNIFAIPLRLPGKLKSDVSDSLPRIKSYRFPKYCKITNKQVWGWFPYFTLSIRSKTWSPCKHDRITPSKKEGAQFSLLIDVFSLSSSKYKCSLLCDCSPDPLHETHTQCSTWSFVGWEIVNCKLWNCLTLLTSLMSSVTRLHVKINKLCLCECTYHNYFSWCVLWHSLWVRED